MATLSSVHAEQAVRSMKGIALEAAATRRRCAADLAVHSLDLRAFDHAAEIFDEVMFQRYRPPSHADADDRDRCRSDAQLEALERFLRAYLTEAGR